MGIDREAFIVHTYSLSDLLGGALTLVIPDMQRDFSWGGEQATALVRGLVQVYEGMSHADMKPSPVGMVYGYSTDKGHIYVIDGQQRLTTLYLLLGMLYRRTRMPRLRNMIVNEDSGLEQIAPRILYQAKREALYFMADLTRNFFLDRNGRLSLLEQSPWYYSSYSADVSVQSFIGAIRRIDAVLEECAAIPGWDFEAFTEFVASNVVFRYCDLGSREVAEKTFVTINTTGEPLTLAQNLRALHLAKHSAEPELDTRWNEMEQWGWTHRPMPDSGSDAMLDKVFTLIARYLSIASEDYDASQPAMAVLAEQKASAIYALFKAFERAFAAVGPLATETLGDCPLDDAPLQHMLWLPAIAYSRRFPDASDTDILRFWRYIANITRYQKPSPSGSDALLGIQLAQKMPDRDILSVLQLKHVPDRICNEEEKTKLRIMRESKGNRQRLEAILERGQSHPLMCGQMAQLVKWCTSSGILDIDMLARYVDAIYRIFGTEIDRRDSLDPLRRTLLALRHPGYPIERKGGSIMSMCWHEYDWQRLMANSPGLIRLLIDRLDDFTEEEIIAKYNRREDPFYRFVKDGALLASCRKKQCIRPCKPFIGYYDLKLGRTRWMIEQKMMHLDLERWSPWRTYGTRCLYADCLDMPISVSVHYTPGSSYEFRIEISERDTEARPRGRRLDLSDVVPMELGYRYNRRSTKYTAVGDSSRILSLLKRL